MRSFDVEGAHFVSLNLLHKLFDGGDRMDDKGKQDFFDAIRHGSFWHSKKISEHLVEIIEARTDHFSTHSLRWNQDQGFYYVYDNECYLFVSDNTIEVRSDRENVFSSGQIIDFPITEAQDISDAYQKFVSMTREAEDE